MLALRRILSEPADKRTGSPTAMTDAFIALLTMLLIAGAMPYATVPTDLPVPVPASVPSTDFSSGRPLTHIRAIEWQPHPMGSPANAAVRDYLVRELASLGLQPEVQNVTVAHEACGELIAGTPENVVARMKLRTAVGECPSRMPGSCVDPERALPAQGSEGHTAYFNRARPHQDIQ